MEYNIPPEKCNNIKLKHYKLYLKKNELIRKIQNAFYSVNHDSFPYLAPPGFVIFYCLRSYMFNRPQIGLSVVPQWSHLHLFFLYLFIIFKVNTVKISHGKILCFADDIKNYIIRSEILNNCLQSDLDHHVSREDCLFLILMFPNVNQWRFPETQHL